MNLAEDITSFINAVRTLCNAGICFYDLKDFFNYGSYGEKMNKGHYCSFCKKARTLPIGRQKCDESDRENAVLLAKQYKKPFFHECHLGMRELVVPLIENDVLIGIIFVGQCRLDENYEATIFEKAKKITNDPSDIVRLYNQLPVVSREIITNVGEIIFHYFSTQIQNIELLFGELRKKEFTGTSLADGIRDFIELNFQSRISTKEIAQVFHVNLSYASRCFSKKFGITITNFILQTRIDYAKLLLTQTKASINDISFNVGFEDSNYFSRLFKKNVGCSPKQYREQLK